jgi:hypothetical protein
MDIISRSFDEIAARAPGAHREIVDMLTAQHRAIDDAAKTAISLGTITDAELTSATDARHRSQDAIDAAFSAILKRQYGAIARLPEHVRERWSFSPMSAPALLRSTLEHGEAEVTSTIRNQGVDIVCMRGDERLGSVEAHGITVGRDDLKVEGVGRWPLADIEAVGVHEGMAFILADGTLVTLRDPSENRD